MAGLMCYAAGGANYLTWFPAARMGLLIYDGIRSLEAFAISHIKNLTITITETARTAAFKFYRFVLIFFRMYREIYNSMHK